MTTSAPSNTSQVNFGLPTNWWESTPGGVGGSGGESGGESDPTGLEAGGIEFLNQSIALQQEHLAIQSALADRFIALGESQERRANQLFGIYTGTYLPIEREFARASAAGIPVDQELAWASADVDAAFDKAWSSQQRNMSRLGVDASDPAYNRSMTRDYELARAAAEAGARNGARRNIRDTNYERRRQVVAFGKGIPVDASGISASAATAYGGASSATSAGYNGVNGALNMGINMGQADLDRALRQQEIDNGLTAAKYDAIGGAIGGIAGAVGTFAGLSALCWVAREVYGASNPKWRQFRYWMLTQAPAQFRERYIRYGAAVARSIANKPDVKDRIRQWMDQQISTLSPA